MNSETDLKSAWRAQAIELPARSPEELREAAQAFQDLVARRNRREYLAGAIVVGVFLFYMYLFPSWLMRLGAALVVLGTLFVMWQLGRRAGARALPADLGDSGLRFQRAELARQREALRGVWRWYLAPLVPGLVVFLWGAQAGAMGPIAWVVDGVVVLVLVSVAWINQRAAARLQREIEALDALS